MGRCIAWGVLALLGSVGCGLDENGLALGDAAAPFDVSTQDVTKDSAPTDGSKSDAPGPPVEAGVCDEDANGCQAPEVPPGWNPVAYVENPQTGCPSPDWTAQDDYVTSIANGNATCGCTCTKTADPDCTTGTIATFYSNVQTTCGAPGIGFTFSKGACLAVNASLATYYASTALAPAGTGACTVQPTSGGAIQTTPARLCAPDPQCTSAACDGKAPTGFAACIVADGDQACPSGSSFTVKHAVAKSAAGACSPTCGSACTVAGTCDSPQVEFFSQSNCTGPVVTLPSDTTCSATNHAGQSIGGVTYSATPNFKCSTSATSSVQISLTTPRTVCCRP